MFRHETIVVTDRRILFQTHSFAVSAVSSVGVEPEKRRRIRVPRPSAESAIAGVMVAAGAGLAVGGFYVAREMATVQAMLIGFGVVTALAGIVVLWFARNQNAGGRQPRYSLRITTMDGEKTRVRGLDKETARRLADAISSATAR